MDSPEQPQIYLITPAAFELSLFPETLARVLDSTEISCIRLALSSRDEDQIARSADALREVAHKRDVALVVTEHVLLAERLGLDGVHLEDAVKSVRAARKTLGQDAIVGSYCGTSRHDGMSAGEAGADYVSFGPVGNSSLGDGATADRDIFEWWSDFIEIPVVAEGNLTPDLIASFASYTDFFGIGDEIWQTEDPSDTLNKLLQVLK